MMDNVQKINYCILTKGFGGFPQFLQTNAGIKPQSDHSHFLPHSFQFISATTI
jgi:hypothetical protein